MEGNKDNIEKILLFNSIENGEVKYEACAFYKDQTLKYLSYEEVICTLRYLLKRYNASLQDLKSNEYKKVEFLSKKDFEHKYGYQIKKRLANMVYQKHIESLKNEEEKPKKKKTKSSILDRVSFIKRPIKKAALIGGLALTLITGFNKVGAQDSELLVSAPETSVKNLEVDTPAIDLSEDTSYVLNKNKEEAPRKITINKGIEKEIIEVDDEKKLRQAKEKRIKFIDYYSRVYNLNENKVLKIIEKTTNLLSKKELKKKIDNDALEFTILKTVETISASSFGEIKKDNYEKTKTYREMVRHYSKLFGVDANKALAIELLESGYYTSSIATEKHNPGALKFKGVYLTFENMEQGIIAHIKRLRYYYNGQSISAMARKYCGSKKGAPGWASQVQTIYNQLENNPNAYTLADEKASQKVKKKNDIK